MGFYISLFVKQKKTTLFAPSHLVFRLNEFTLLVKTQNHTTSMEEYL